MKHWQQYQEEAAALFRLLGLDPKTEARVTGVRGEHDIDVYVTGSLHGIKFTWVVECKAWQSNIPKEKVMALAAIVEDIGADRGFLLSEIGFQSGAIRQASKRNITLTSIQDLKETVDANAADQALVRLAWRAECAKKEIWRQFHEGGKYLTEFLISWHWFYLGYLAEAFDEAVRNKYPIVYKSKSKESPELIANNIDELIAGAEAVIVAAEAYLAENP
jgi:hypothetical protein